ncbi:glycosyltransferase family 4 protein [Allobranchiibius huperziae]|uniref:D-inositol 3-phosphate glycosyltransferase n=1 Tax=Allobranchiibius huperziae TaxID=1874116 RepID=A0A853DNU8_9MICO|nr:glycosyltransferase family 4 protein [Allobranchiibius huperziae]NYJ76431.1 glycosyltransferase involved in cell wall biosynthesis [Allobranchiibius huperziae]
MPHRRHPLGDAPMSWRTPSLRDADRLRVAMLAPARNDIAPPFSGGLESMVWHLRSQLVADGHEVTLIAREGSDEVEDQWALDGGRWAPSELATQDHSMPAAEFMTEHHTYLSAMRRLAAVGHFRFDVIHNHSLHYLPLAMADTCEVPILTTLHTPPTPWLESAIASATGKVGGFTAVSDYTARSWDRLPEVPAVIHNGVDLDWWHPGPGGDRLWWSGRITPDKAPHLAIEAARLAHLPLDFAGPISDQAYFEREIRHRLGSDIRYLGHLSGAAQVEHVRHARAVLVTPTWDEPFGLVVIEALACGTPVVAFGRGGIPDILTCSRIGRLVPADDVAAMAQAVQRVDEISRAEVRRFAERHFSLRQMSRSYVDAYRAVIASSLPRIASPHVLAP